MQRYRHLWVGLSLDDSGTSVSPGTRQAVEQALWLAGRVEGTVTMLHARDEGEFEQAATRDVPAEGLTGDAAIEHAPEPLATFVREACTQHTCLGFELVTGRPEVGISRRVAAHVDSLVVVGKRNTLTPRTRRLGTIASRLVHVCPAPVWVVHGTRPFPPRHVLAATDLTPVGARATRIAAWFAKATSAQLEIVHAWQYPMELEFERAHLSPAEFERRCSTITDACHQKIVDGLEGEHEGVPTKMHVGNSVPSHAIHELLDRYDVDLLVLGTKGRVGLPGVLIGNTAERLLHDVDCSLFAVKPDGFESPVLR